MSRHPDHETTEILSFDGNEASRLLFGKHNENLKIIEDSLGIGVDTRGSEVTLRGKSEKVKLALGLLNQLHAIAEKGFPLSQHDTSRAVRILESDPNTELAPYFFDKIFSSSNGKRAIIPKTPGQKAYVEAIRKYDLTFSVGPAGTGKTYLAMAMAVGALLRKEYKRIILTRPAVEAGERLGFLPGDLVEKINPYLRPLYDALYDMVEVEKAHQWMANGVVEVAPLAFMRGRTLNDSFIVLDEAQNTTSEQMKMFLTRMGFGSKAVVTGDITQIDLPTGALSGLIHATRILDGVPGIAICRFSKHDVVRHPIVQLIVEAYEGSGKG